MKKVVSILVDKEVLVEEVKNNSFVGIIFAEEQEKSWIAFTVKGYQGMSIGEQDMSSHWSEKSKRDYVNTALGIGAQVFLFETYGEFIKWLKS